MNLQEFFLSILSQKQIDDINEYGNYVKGHPMTYLRTVRLLQSIQEGSIRETFPFLPECVDYNASYDIDQEVGGWIERFVLNTGDKFYEIYVDFYGQGYVGENCKEDSVKQVYPTSITKIIYE